MLKIELEREEDGRWIAEVPDLPGFMTYGATREEAIARAEVLALRVLADRVENGEPIPALKRCLRLHDGLAVGSGTARSFRSVAIRCGRSSDNRARFAFWADRAGTTSCSRSTTVKRLAP